MSKISKELIENYKKIVLPYVSNQLYKADFEGQGETDKTEFKQDFNEILNLAIKALEEERPQGEWKLHGMIYYCTNCGKDYEQGGNNYCGNCGADMRGTNNG